MEAYKAYKFRLYPTDNQKVLIHKTFGCVRFVYNHFLDYQKNNGFKKSFDLCKDLKVLNNEYEFLKEVDSCALRCAIFNLENAYKNFFAKRGNYPVFKGKRSYQSYKTNCIVSSYKNNTYSNIKIDLEKRQIKLPKLGLVNIRGYRNKKELEGRIISATIIKEATGKYYVSVIVEEEAIIKEKVIPSKAIGIDLGVKDLVITSDYEKYDNNKIIAKYEKRLKRLQRELARREKGGKNYNKTKLKIARLHEKIRNTRKHYLNKIANEIVLENDIIVTENLKVKDMSKNKRLAKYILDASFSKLCSLLEWKSKLQGKFYYKIDTYYPSSQICSYCGQQDASLKDLSIREYKCQSCGRELDRDINASINILFEGLKLHYQN